MNTILFIFFLLLVVISMSGCFFWKVPWAPTRKKDYNRIAKLASLQSNMCFYDLGSGTGHLLFYLAKKYNINCVGIEVSPLLYLYSKIRSLFCKNVKIKYGNFFKHDLSEVDVAYIFLRAHLYKRIESKIDTEFKKNAKIIVSVWPFENLNFTRVDRERNGVDYFLYKKPFIKK
jgi:SAM-dependent methyltransferase